MIPMVEAPRSGDGEPDPADLGPAVAAGAADEASRRIVVLSPKGGPGRTTVAVNLALALAARRPGRVGLVDLSLSFGDVASALLLDPRHGLGRLARAPRPLAPASVKAVLSRHESGLQVLCAPDSPALAEAFSSEDVADVLDGLVGELPDLVIDTPAGLDAATLVAVERATDLVLVASLDVPTLLGLRQALDVLDRLGMRGARRHLVLNRTGPRTGIEPADVESTLGLPVVVAIADTAAVATATNEGHPIVAAAPRSPAGRAFAQLAADLDPAPVPTSSSRFARRRGAGA